MEAMVDSAMEVSAMVALEMDLEVTEVDINLERGLLMLTLMAMEVTLEVMVDLAMEVMAKEDLDMDLEVIGVVTILERGQQKLNPTVLMETLVIMHSTKAKVSLDMDMAALDHTVVDLSEPNFSLLFEQGLNYNKCLK